MENNLLYCYKDWLEKEEGTIFKMIFRIPIKILVLLISLIVVLVAFIVIGFLGNKDNNLSIVETLLAGIYIALCIAVSICTERHQIKNSKNDWESYKSYCVKLKTYLTQERKISLSLFPDLIARLKSINDNIDEKIRHTNEQFNKFMDMLLIPISAVILGALIDKDMSVTETLELGLSGAFIIFGIYGVIIFVLFVINSATRAPQSRYRRFAADLQSILDFEACDSDTESNAETTSTLTETTPENEEPQTQTVQ